MQHPTSEWVPEPVLHYAVLDDMPSSTFRLLQRQTSVQIEHAIEESKGFDEQDRYQFLNRIRIIFDTRDKLRAVFMTGHCPDTSELIMQKDALIKDLHARQR